MLGRAQPHDRESAWPGLHGARNSVVDCASNLSSIETTAKLLTSAGTQEADDHDACVTCSDLLSRAVRDFVVPGSNHRAVGKYVLVAPPGHGWTNYGGCVANGQVLTCNLSYNFTANLP